MKPSRHKHAETPRTENRLLKHRLVSVLAVFALFASTAHGGEWLPTAGPVFEVETTAAIVYGTGEVNAPLPGQKPLLLDLYEPVTDSGPRPAVVIIHGGGFVGGSRRQGALVEMAEGLAARGFVAVSIDYRLAGDAPVTSARVQPLLDAVLGLAGEDERATAVIAAIDDSLTAIDWLLEHAEELNVNSSQIGVMGGSAGAVTSIHLAYTLDDYGITAPELLFVVDFWGMSLIPPDSAEAAARLLESGEAALFAVHGTADPTVPFEGSELLAARALDQGVPVEFHPIEGAGHGFGQVDIFSLEAEPGVTIENRMYAWLRKITSFMEFNDVEGGWLNAETPGQGFLFDYDPATRDLFVAWFTYDTLAAIDEGDIPGAEQRWFTAEGKAVGNRADLTVYLARDGRFDERDAVQNEPVGRMIIEFDDCNSGSLEYDLDTLGLSGSMQIARLLTGSTCETAAD